jgi:hypothetical protein
MSYSPLTSTNTLPYGASGAIGSVAPTGPMARPTVATGASATDAVEGSPKPHDGHILTALKSSLAAQGFTATPDSGASSSQMLDAMHGFSQAFFAALHDQRQADRAAGTPTDVATAVRELSAAASAGTAPADLQSAFGTLQQTQGSGDGSGASLSAVLAGTADDLATGTASGYNGVGSGGTGLVTNLGVGSGGTGLVINATA